MHIYERLYMYSYAYIYIYMYTYIYMCVCMCACVDMHKQIRFVKLFAFDTTLHTCCVARPSRSAQRAGETYLWLRRDWITDLQQHITGGNIQTNENGRGKKITLWSLWMFLKALQKLSASEQIQEVNDKIIAALILSVLLPGIFLNKKKKIPQTHTHIRQKMCDLEMVENSCIPMWNKQKSTFWINWQQWF